MNQYVKLFRESMMTEEKGTITDRAMKVAEDNAERATEALSLAQYWMDRCLAAEKFIRNIHSPLSTHDSLETKLYYDNWRKLVNTPPPPSK